MKKLIKSLKLWVVYRITYYEITYGELRRAYGCYSKQERKSIAYNIATEYLNF